MASRSTVPVPRGVLVALVAALAIAVLLAAFLLGRQSARPAPGKEATASRTQAAAAPDETIPPSSSDVAPEEPPPSALPAATPAPLLLPPAAPEPVGREREEVARYFQESEAIQARAKYWTDPQALAKTLVEQAASGNAGAFDELIRAQQGAGDELARLAVPAACAEHHRRSLAVMREGVALLERVRGAVTSGDLGGLDGLPSSSRDLEREAREIDELGRQIRQRFGS